MHRRSRVALSAALVLGLGVQSSAEPQQQPATFFASTSWSLDDPNFGGLSAIDLKPDGIGFTVLSDRGFWTSGRLIRDEDDKVTGAEAKPFTALRGTSGDPLHPWSTDSEGLALAADGKIYVSFETPGLVLHFAAMDATPEALPSPEAFGTMRRNGALEALAIDDGGTLYTLSEHWSPREAPFPVFRFRDGDWTQPFGLPRSGLFLPVGADFGPDGRLYLLERRFQAALAMFGFSSQIRSFAVGEDGLTDERVLLTSPPGRHDNLEGISVWRDAGGMLRLTMVSDDNLIFLQRNQIVEYRLAE